MNQSHVVGAFKRISAGYTFGLLFSVLAFISDAAPTSTPLKMFLPKGLRARIDCPATANPPLTVIVWAKNNMIIDTEKVKRLNVDKSGMLTITQVQAEDEGLYTCTPYSPFEKTYHSVHIQVLVKDLPFFTIRPLPVYQRLMGQTIVMPCVVEGDPKPIIFWKKVDGRFPSKTKTLLAGGNLTIVHLSSAEQGTYECIARNAVTTIITATLLLVQTAADEHPHNISVETTSSTAKVSWLPPYVNDSQLYRYELWCQMLRETSTDDDWQRFDAIPDNATSVTVYNLLPNTSYKFKVLSNHTGKFHFSQEVVATTNVLSGHHSRSITSATFTKQPIRSSSATGLSHPFPPTNLSIIQHLGGINLRWQRPRNSPVPVEFYVVEYQTGGQWIRIVERIPGSQTEFQWTKTLPVSATYQFRVLSAGGSIFSSPSATVTIVLPEAKTNKDKAALSSDKMAGIITGILFLVVTVVVIVLVMRFHKRKQKKLPEMAYKRSEEVSLNANISINRALEGRASPLEESISILDNHALDRHNNYEAGHIQETPI